MLSDSRHILRLCLSGAVMAAAMALGVPRANATPEMQTLCKHPVGLSFLTEGYYGEVALHQAREFTPYYCTGESKIYRLFDPLYRSRIKPYSFAESVDINSFSVLGMTLMTPEQGQISCPLAVKFDPKRAAQAVKTRLAVRENENHDPISRDEAYHEIIKLFHLAQDYVQMSDYQTAPTPCPMTVHTSRKDLGRRFYPRAQKSLSRYRALDTQQSKNAMSYTVPITCITRVPFPPSSP